jgi:Ca2+-binding RTX toxin-like protein
MPAEISNIGFDWLGAQGFEANHRGTPGDDLLVGGDGNDIFTGQGGDDTFVGGAGDDLFRNGTGADSIVGGGGFDRMSFGFYSTWDHGAYVNLGTGAVIDGDGNIDHVTGISAIGFGTQFADTLIGDDRPNLIWGGAGDVLMGLGGDDVIAITDAPALVDGGAGVNSLWFGGGRFIFNPPLPVTDFEVASHGVNIDLGKGLILDDGFGGSGAVVNIQDVYGSPQGDVIVGDKRDNVIAGMAGDDTLTGGGGHDIFLFDATSQDFNGDPQPDGHDVITDFKPHQDKIAIDMPGVNGFADLTITGGPHGSLIITYGADQDTITLLHTHQVNADDFIFGAP